MRYEKQGGNFGEHHTPTRRLDFGKTLASTGGENPGGSLSRGDAFGNFCGTTIGGGSGTGCGTQGCGVLYALTAFGKEIVVHDFSLSSSSDGANPYGGVIRDQSDNFYGTLSAGGGYGCGAVFVFTPPGGD